MEWRPYIHGEHAIHGQSVQWLTNGHEKYVWFSGDGREQLFDLDKDPSELHDLARAPGAEARIKPWRQALVTELSGREEGFVAGDRLVTGRPTQACLRRLRNC